MTVNDWIAQARVEYAPWIAALARLGVTGAFVQHTGGGCMAVEIPLAGDLYVWCLGPDLNEYTAADGTTDMWGFEIRGADGRGWLWSLTDNPPRLPFTPENAASMLGGILHAYQTHGVTTDGAVATPALVPGPSWRCEEI